MALSQSLLDFGDWAYLGLGLWLTRYKGPIIEATWRIVWLIVGEIGAVAWWPIIEFEAAPHNPNPQDTSASLASIVGGRLQSSAKWGYEFKFFETWISAHTKIKSQINYSNLEMSLAPSLPRLHSPFRCCPLNLSAASSSSLCLSHKFARNQRSPPSYPRIRALDLDQNTVLSSLYNLISVFVLFLLSQIYSQIFYASDRL